MSDAGPKIHEELIGAVIHDRYRVDRLLGSGGMGTVYLAEHVLMKKPVALKVLHPEMLHLQEIVARFEREAIAAGRIDHPNVAGATDFGRLEDGSLYLVLEYVDGRSLSDLLKEGPLGVERVLSIGRQIAAALSAAHAAAVVHRDLKPDNVMLVHQDGRDLVKVLDFGIAKVLDDGPADKRDSKSEAQLTRIGTVMGTASYMSPEQAIGQQVDPRADLYSFGVMLYEMLAGRRPFEGEELAQIIAKQLTEVPPPLPQTTPTEITLVVNKLLEKRPDDRVQSAAELVEIFDGLRESLFGIAPASSEKSIAFPVPISAEAVSSSAVSPAVTASVSVGEEGSSTRKTRAPMVAAGLLAIAALGGLWAWTRASGDAGDASSAPSAMPSIAPVASVRSDGPGYLARTPPGLRATAAAATTAPTATTATTTAGSPTATSTTTTTTETSVTHSNGETVTTKKTTTRTRSTTKRRRREGPGGIYIPPPSEWF